MSRRRVGRKSEAYSADSRTIWRNALRFSALHTHCSPLLCTTRANQSYDALGVRFSVAQIEEIGFTQFWKRKTELLEALGSYRHSNGYFFSALLVTDVNSQSSLLLAAGGSRFTSGFDYPRIEPGVYELKDIVSRKKQLLPYLTHCLEQMKL